MSPELRHDQVMQIRPAVPVDLPELYQVCLLTGNAGQDATATYTNGDLLGEIYVGPYVVLSPETSFALIDEDNKPVGYVLGVLDSLDFESKRKAIWLTELQKKYQHEFETINKLEPTADQVLIAEIFNPTQLPYQILEDYPSHGHIDIRPEHQGKGLGIKMMDLLLNHLKNLGSKGIYLQVASTNQRALTFYEKLGFVELLQRGDETIVGKKFI
jgi:ribosomal protein S18 acetylase RimI-like enzyme